MSESAPATARGRGRARSHLSRACRVARADRQIEAELALCWAVTGLLCCSLLTMKRGQTLKLFDARRINLVPDIVVLGFRKGFPGVPEVCLIIDTNMRFMSKVPHVNSPSPPPP